MDEEERDLGVDGKSVVELLGRKLGERSVCRHTCVVYDDVDVCVCSKGGICCFFYGLDRVELGPVLFESALQATKVGDAHVRLNAVALCARSIAFNLVNELFGELDGAFGNVDDEDIGALFR